MNVELMVHETCALLTQVKVKPTLINQINKSQFTDPWLVKIFEEVKNEDLSTSTRGKMAFFALETVYVFSILRG